MRRRVKIGRTFDLTVSVDENPLAPNDQGKRKPVSKRIAVGQEFDAKISLPKVRGNELEEITRARIVWAVFAVIAAFLFGAAGLGLYSGGFDALQNVWSVAGPIYGGIAGYFFHRQHKK